jgi:hypothetical protein
MGKEALSIFGHLHGVRGPLNQLQTLPSLQKLQAAADGGLAYSQLVGGSQQTANLDNAHKSLDEFDAIRSRRQGTLIRPTYSNSADKTSTSRTIFHAE